MFDVLSFLEDNKIDIFFATETWLQDDTNLQTGLTSECSPYNIYHIPRKSRGGGVAIFAQTSLRCKQINCKRFESFEHTIVIIGSKNKTKLLCVYRKDCISFNVFLDEFADLISQLLTSPIPFLMCGDFNIRWNLHTDSKRSQFQDLINEYGIISSTPSSPTHVLGNTIDFVLSDSFVEPFISGVHVNNNETLSDHFPITFNLQLQESSKSNNNIPKIKFSRNLRNIHIDFFKMDLRSALSKAFENHESQSFCDLQSMFSAALGQVIEVHAPLKKSMITYDPRPDWMDHEYVLARNLRRTLEDIAKRTQDEDDHFRYCRQRDWCCTLANHKRTEYYSSYIADRAGDQKALFQIFDKLLGASGSPPLPTVSDPTSLPDLLNNFFIDKIDTIHDSILENADIIDIQTNYPNYISDIEEENDKNKDIDTGLESSQALESPQTNNSNISIYEVVDSPQIDDASRSRFLDEFDLTTIDELRKIIKDAGVKTCQLDPLPASLLKECVEEVLPYLVVLVNSSLRYGSIEGLKEAVVRPLLKKAGLDPNKFANLRPISNTSFVSKLVERVVNVRLNTHMDLNGLQSDTQHGYKKNHGTETLLVHFIDSLLVAVDKGLGVVVVLIDLSAAFDTVNHDVLLRILGQEIGLRGTALKWFRSFLTNRSQRVSTGENLSSPLHLKFGVPQGSVLGPILFNIYTRSLSKVFLASGFATAGYADDNSGAYAFAHNSQYDVLINQIPDCLSRIKSWMDLFSLKLNETKTEIIVFGGKNFLKEKLCIHGTFLNSGSCLRFTDTVKYLGVFLDNYITFNTQVNNISSSCYMYIRKLASIRKFLSQKDCETLVHSFISSRLDSCNALLFGISRANIMKLQKIQNAAARLILRKKKRESVKEALKDLHWLNIDQRLSYKILLLVFKCLHNLAPSSLIKTLSVKTTNTLILQTKYFPKTNLGRRAFSFYAPRQWNCLPESLRCTEDIESYKSQLKTYLFSDFTNFCQRYNKYDNLLKL
jgi:exonuclease III